LKKEGKKPSSEKSETPDRIGLGAICGQEARRVGFFAGDLRIDRESVLSEREREEKQLRKEKNVDSAKPKVEKSKYRSLGADKKGTVREKRRSTKKQERTYSTAKGRGEQKKKKKKNRDGGNNRKGELSFREGGGGGLGGLGQKTPLA